MDTRRKNQLFFYLDIVILGVGAIALVTLVHDAFYAGYASTADAAAFDGYVWRMALEAGATIVAAVYFLARFFKVRVRELANPWG
jgi:hypothetical protein